MGNVERRERLRRLALETIDLDKDPYFMKNHCGKYECRLCLTLHSNEGSYLAHTQGKRHQKHLAKRATKDCTEKAIQPYPEKRMERQKNQRSLLFQIYYPEIDYATKPYHRLMSSFE